MAVVAQVRTTLREFDTCYECVKDSSADFVTAYEFPEDSEDPLFVFLADFNDPGIQSIRKTVHPLLDFFQGDFRRSALSPELPEQHDHVHKKITGSQIRFLNFLGPKNWAMKN